MLVFVVLVLRVWGFWFVRLVSGVLLLGLSGAVGSSFGFACVLGVVWWFVFGPLAC